MPESKQKKIIMASTVTAVLLLAILVVVLVYQLASIGTLKKKRAALRAEIERYEAQLEGDMTELEKWQTLEWIEKKARELGMYYEGDKDFR